jgi:glycosyltransferase involved in cell wall biosynthesis
MTHTPGDAIRETLLARGVPHAVVWGRGVDSGSFHPGNRHVGLRRWLSGADDRVIVLHVGRLAPEKNIRILARAFGLARECLGPRAAFVVAGEGPLRRWLEGQVPFARFLGFLEPDSLAAVYASADLCVLPSFTETCGLVALEAMASGLPVIAARAGGFRESVRDGENGVLAPPDDATAFAAATIALFADADRRREMGAAGRRTAVSRSATDENAVLLEHYAALAAATPGAALASPATGCFHTTHEALQESLAGVERRA